MELAAEGSRPIDLGGCGDPRCALLVSGLGQDRNTAQYRSSTTSRLLADRAWQGRDALQRLPSQDGKSGSESARKHPLAIPGRETQCRFGWRIAYDAMEGAHRLATPGRSSKKLRSALLASLWWDTGG